MRPEPPDQLLPQGMRVAAQPCRQVERGDLRWLEEARPLPGVGHAGNLDLREPAPPRRGGVRAQSGLAAVDHGCAQEDQLLGPLGDGALRVPERGADPGHDLLRAGDERDGVAEGLFSTVTDAQAGSWGWLLQAGTHYGP